MVDWIVSRARAHTDRRGLGLRSSLLTGVCVLALAPAFWVLWPGTDTTAAPNRAGAPAEAHASWTRHLTLEDLMRDATTVVNAQVLRIEEEIPITPEMAGAPADKPSLPRERITFIREKSIHGADPGETFSVIHVLPPKGTVLPEDPPYRAGEQYLLFLQRGEPLGLGPEWELVGLDGRVARANGGRLDGYLPNGPQAELRTVQRDLDSAVEEATR